MARRVFVYEPKVHPPISSEWFARRVLLHAAAALAVLTFSLAIGMAGYEHFEELPWRDAVLNAAMLMGGMGPVELCVPTVVRCSLVSMGYMPAWSSWPRRAWSLRQ